MARRLLALPEEILLAIMQELDPTSLQCLRRVSRIFLRLFSDRCFRDLHRDVPVLRPSQTRFPWLRGNAEFEAKAYTKAFRYLLSQDEKQRICLACRITQAENPRKGWDLVNEYLFCSACIVDHPMAFFSAAERSKGEDEKRTCIGHQGHIRLCQHETITLDDVIGAKSRLMVQVAIHPTGAGTAPEVQLKQCRHPSHRPVHIDDFDACCGEGVESEAAIANAWPTAMLVKMGDSIAVWMAWTGHLHVPASETKLPAQEMATRLRELRRGAAEYLVPQSGPGMIPEMRCFDPNHCCCLDYGEAYPRSAQWSLTPCFGRTNTDTCCRLDPSHCLIPMTRDTPRATDGLRNRHNAATDQRMAFKALSGWIVRANDCQMGRRQCLEFMYARFVSCCTDLPIWRTLDPAWFEALDPDSYRLWEDLDTKGSLWCPDPGCANYYHYLERPIIRRCHTKNIYDPSKTYYEHGTLETVRIKGVAFTGIAPIFVEQQRIARELAATSGDDRLTRATPQPVTSTRTRVPALASSIQPHVVPRPTASEHTGALSVPASTTRLVPWPQNSDPTRRPERPTATANKTPALSKIPAVNEGGLSNTSSWRRRVSKLRSLLSGKGSLKKHKDKDMSAADATRKYWSRRTS